MTADANRAGPAPAERPEPARVSLLWAVQGHASAIAGLHGELFAEPWDATAIAGMLAHPGSIALVATAANPMDIGGFALAQVAADEAEILTLGVAAPWQRGGVATRLVEGIKRAASRGGARALFLEVAASNTAARALYARAGFAEAGHRIGYYARKDAPAEDAVVMRCALGAG